MLVCGCMVDIYMVANLILLCCLRTYLPFKTRKSFRKKTGTILFISFFLGGHLSTHCFRYLEHLSIFSLLFLNNFCIAQAYFRQQNFWEIATRTWSIYLVDENLENIFLVFTLSVGVKSFWVDLNEKHVFMPTPSVEVVHIWVVCTWSWF